MFEVLFILGFFAVLMVTGVSMLGIIAAVAVATVLMLFGGLFVMMLKLLPWMALAIVAVWIYRSMQKKPQPRRYY
ncbi:envelope stress response protein PspG [Hafnia alvei]|uniref:Phage shock protein G n=1 Tax=Hafnia alvei ATCC 51873 TaxID=1002364 RepID=G9YAY9_HAFAL|nr:envelope stress response protein PspG [Hafnia alvei]EHM39673.1 phage shock protein G [Hafnia alvei ATCC 51873]QQE42476.1 envelope stress response protein PspG [Hafnia alvei]